MRKEMGRELARETPCDADVVIPVPDSVCRRRSAYAQESGVPYELGIIRNHYVGRTFIEPTQQIRRIGRAAEAQRQSHGDQGQAHRPGGRQHRARHHVGEDCSDDV